MTRSTMLLLAAALTTTLAGGTAAAADAGRGKVLYETRCTDCHTRSVHQRESRKATSFEGIRAQAARWSGVVGTGWAPGDVDDIAAYLNEAYYKLPCPPASCPGKTGTLPAPLALVR